MLLSPDTVLAGRYRIVKLAGRGGMGVVYEAEDTKLGRRVALKLLPPDLNADPGARRRFVHEARAAASLESPNICAVHEIHDEGADPFISMEFIDGQSLRALLAEGPLEICRALDIAIQVARGLQEAGRKGIVHRDIKSANIMITRDGRAKITDFGLAKVRDGTVLTKTGAVMGTAAYMSPEQARGDRVDERTDIWSLGIVLYEMICAKLPFKGESEASVLYAILHEPYARLKDLAPEVPEELDRIVRAALEKKPDARYASAGEVLSDLKACLAGLEAECGGGSKTRLFLKRPSVLATAAVIVAGAALAAVLFTGRKAESETAKPLPPAASVNPGSVAPGNPTQPSAFDGTEPRDALVEKKPLPAEPASSPKVKSQRVTPRAAPDDEAFAQAVSAGTTTAYAEYLRNHPAGNNAPKAMEMLQRLEQEGLAERSRLEAELDDKAFEAAKLEGTPEALDRYLGSFLAGRHAVEARALITSFAEQPVSEPEKPAAEQSAPTRKVGDTITFRTNGVNISMAWIPPGTFNMGTTNIEGGRNQRPLHAVTISRGFWIGLHEVTQPQWTAVMGDNPSKVKSDRGMPVDSVSWEDCQRFVRELSRLTGRTFRLPTEAEWEYACRAGSIDNWYGEWNSIGWHLTNSKNAAHEVGQKRPNNFGLYDMLGNVWEWCQDWYGASYYQGSPPVDPQGPDSGKERSVRGGSWQSEPERAHSAMRVSVQPGSRRNDLGLRLVCEESN